MIVLEPGFDQRSVTEMLRNEPHELVLRTCREVAARTRPPERVDIILLCLTHSGCQGGELLEQISTAHPEVPVIVVTSPSAIRHCQLGQGATNPLPGARLPVGSLAHSVRDALREPRIRRLIRVPNRHGGAQYAAHNTRWLSEEHQLRYGTPFHFHDSATTIPVQFTEPAPPHSPAPLAP